MTSYMDNEYISPSTIETQTKPLLDEDKEILIKAEDAYLREDYTAALDYIESVSNYTNIYEFLYLKGNIYLSENNPNMNYIYAKSIFLALDKLDRNKSTIKNVLGIIYYNIQDYDKAVGYFREAVNYDSKSIKYRRPLIKSLIKANSFQDAYKECYDIINTHKNDVELLEMIGYMEFSMKNLDKALIYYNKANSLKPGNILLLYNLSLCCLRKENYDSAIKYIKEGLVIEPNNLKLLKMLMLANLNTEKWDELEKTCLKISYLNPNSASAISCLCKSFENRQNYKQLYNLLQNILIQIQDKKNNLDKNKSSLLARKIQKKIFSLQKEMLFINSKEEVLKTTTNKSTKSNMRNSIYNKFFESALSKVADNNELDTLRKTAKHKPNNPVVLYKLGNSYLESNKNKEALDVFLKILSIDSKFLSHKVQERIGDSQFKLNNYDDALMHFKTSLELLEEMVENPESYRKMIEENQDKIIEASKKSSSLLRRGTNYNDIISENLHQLNSKKSNEKIILTTESDENLTNTLSNNTESLENVRIHDPKKSRKNNLLISLMRNPSQNIEDSDKNVLNNITKKSNEENQGIQHILEDNNDKIIIKEDYSQEEEGIFKKKDFKTADLDRDTNRNKRAKFSEDTTVHAKTRNEKSNLSNIFSDVMINEIKNNSYQDFEMLFVKIGRCYENTHEYEKAKEFYKKSIDKNPKTLWGNFHYGCLIIKIAELQFYKGVKERKRNEKTKNKLKQLENGKLHSKRSSYLDPITPIDSNYSSGEEDEMFDFYDKLQLTENEFNKEMQYQRNMGLTFIETAWNNNANFKDIYCRYVVELVNVEKYQKAIEIYQSYSSKYPVVIDALVAAAKAYDKEGNLELALELLEEANHYSEFNEFPNKLINLGLIYEKLKMFNKAILIYKNVLNLEPNHFHTLLNLSVLLLDSNEYKRSLKYLKFAEKLRPKSTQVLYYLGKLFKGVGDIDNSLYYLNKCLEIDHTYYQAYITIGEILTLEIDETKLLKAEKCYKTALKFKENGIEALTGLGTVYYLQGDYINANFQLQQAYNIDGRDFKVLMSFGNTLVANERFDRAAEIYSKAIQLGFLNFDIHFSLGNLYMIQEQLDNAIDQYKYAKLDKSNIQPELYNNLGCAYFNKKNYNDAIKCFKKAIKNDIKNKDIYLNLANCYLHTENFANAKEIYIECFKNGNINQDSMFGYIKSIVETNSIDELEQAEQILFKLLKETEDKIRDKNKMIKLLSERDRDLESKSIISQSDRISANTELKQKLKTKKTVNSHASRYSIGDIGNRLNQSNKMVFHVKKSSLALAKSSSIIKGNAADTGEDLESFKNQLIDLENKINDLKELTNRS